MNEQNEQNEIVFNRLNRIARKNGLTPLELRGILKKYRLLYDRGFPTRGSFAGGYCKQINGKFLWNTYQVTAVVTMFKKCSGAGLRSSAGAGEGTAA